jgi:hypothetical protein
MEIERRFEAIITLDSEKSSTMVLHIEGLGSRIEVLRSTMVHSKFQP